MSDGPRRRVRLVLLVFAVAALAGLVRLASNDGGGEDVAARAPLMVRALLADRPQEAALAALAAERANPSTSTELTMLDVAADSQVIERVIDTGAPEVTAAAVLERHLVTAGSNGIVAIWRRSDGALLGQVSSPSPLTALADSQSSMPLLAIATRTGRTGLLDLTDPTRPRIWQLPPALAAGEQLRGLGFSGRGLDVFDQGADVIAVGARGGLGRVDATARQLISRTSLKRLRGPLPWSDEGSLRLSAAKFLPEAFEDKDGLLVATLSGAVAQVDIGRGQGRTVVPPSIVPGRVLSLDKIPYGEPDLAVGATGGLVIPDVQEAGGELGAHLGVPVPGVALDAYEGVWWGGPEGVGYIHSAYVYERAPPFGAPVRRFSVGIGGVAAIHPGGTVSILGDVGAGLSPAQLEPTPIASFDPEGRLLVSRGYDEFHTEKLALVEPRHYAEDEGEDRLVRTYRPDRSWWPEAEDPEALYLDDVAADGEHVVAGGLDPTGRVVALVWDADTGRPEHRLAMGFGFIDSEASAPVARVLPLPGKNQLAVYSAAQELIAVWSTNTWKLELAIPVGSVADVALSPDESTIVAVDQGEDDSSNYVDPRERTTLTFVDVEAGEISHEVTRRAVTHLAWSPDSSSLATVDEAGALRILTADGREEVSPPVVVGSNPQAIAWRPDGQVVAIAHGNSGLVLVDPETGDASKPLVHNVPYRSPDLRWSPDGLLLAGTSEEFDQTGEGTTGPLMVWALNASRLERRMCQLAGRPARSQEWESYVGKGSPRSLCRPPLRRGPIEPEHDDASTLGSFDLVFQRKGFLVAADLDGNHARIGRLESYPSPMPAYDWSGDALAWSSPGQVNVLTKGEGRARSWPCMCSGLAWHRGAVVSLEVSGRALIRIDPARGELRVLPVQGSLPYSPTLLGLVGNRALIAAYDREPDRSTPSRLFVINPDGRVRKLPGNTRGSIFGHQPSASPHTLAFVSWRSGGVCYSTSSIGVISEREGKIEVRYPPSPLGGEAMVVRSLQVAADGSVSATVSPLGCDKGTPAETEPVARRMRLSGDGWQQIGGRGWDVQSTAAGVAVLEQSEDWGVPGELALVADGKRELLAPDAERMVARP